MDRRKALKVDSERLSQLLLGIALVLLIVFLPEIDSRWAQAASPTQATHWPTPFKLSTVQTATSHPDGSVFHIVQPGEVLITIAEAYKVELSDLLKLNGLTANSVIYPKQKLMIKPPDPTAAVTSTPTKTPRPPTATRSPTRTPTVTPTSPPAPTPTQQTASLSVESDPLLLIIALLIVVGTGLVVAGGFLKRRSGS
jgi:hypothetical protein